MIYFKEEILAGISFGGNFIWREFHLAGISFGGNFIWREFHLAGISFDVNFIWREFYLAGISFGGLPYSKHKSKQKLNSHIEKIKFPAKIKSLRNVSK